MFKNYIKTAIRSFKKNKVYSFLNIFGLAIGIACAGLIFLWVEDEVNFDDFNTKKDNLYLIRENQKYDTYTATFGSTPGLMGPAMQAEIPGVATTCRVYDMDAVLFNIGNKSIYATGYYADASIFSMFTLPFVQGNARTAFTQLYSLVITEKAAVKFFGKDGNVIGKIVRLDNKQDYVVSGVLKDIPENSSIKFEFVAPFKIIGDQSPWLSQWGNNALTTYVELKQGVKPELINKRLYNFIQQREPQSNARPFLWNMSQWHLYDQFENGKATGGGQITYVHLFSVIAWIILFIACINFMNLATARSEKRAREVGMRKVLGAEKKTLIAQFIGEALFMAAFSALIAILLILIVLPAFNTLVQKNLSIGFGNPVHVAILFLITLICGLVAGSYPSLYLSSFNPVTVLKGIKLKTGGANFIRKGLVVLQFSISIILIICTIIVFQQIQHVKNRDLGFSKNNLIEASMQGDVSKYYAVTKQDLLGTGMVENIAMSDHTILYGGHNTASLTWEGKVPGTQILVSGRNVTNEFIQTSGLKILEGRDFIATDSITSKVNNVIITQSLEKLMGKGSAVGKQIWNNNHPNYKLTIIGVVHDYVYGNMYGQPDPVAFSCVSPKDGNKMYLRIKPRVNMEQALAKVEGVVKKDNPAYPFEYKFVDEQFNQMFLSELLISKLSRVFAALAIFISCLGLFGLAAYTAERRKKEIGIRKVLGASVSGITTLLSKDFLQLVAISCLVAFPAAWWAMDKWLQNYQYRIGISWWIFVSAGFTAILIALFTISFQAVKAALANPVKSLRSE
jgi:putative ABC transport system permease protein